MARTTGAGGAGMSKRKQDCLETYGLDIPVTVLGIAVAIFIVYAFIMLAIEAIKDLLN